MNSEKLAVLNPGGTDPFQDFSAGAGPVNDRIHAPVNYHAYAACTGGAFHRKTATIPGEQKRVLVLLRRDLKPALAAIKELKARGKTVAVSWKESGLHQVAGQLATPKALLLFKEICSLADGAISSTPDLVPVYQSMGARVVEFIPTPYPVDNPHWDFSNPGWESPAVCWDFSAPVPERSGILIGTREFDVPSRNHLHAILAALQLGQPLTVFNPDGRSGRKRIESLASACGGQIQILEGRLPYSQYLRVMSRHQLVFQLDRSAVPGQAAGDALLCRIPCVGGDSAIERIAFPDLCGGANRDASHLVEIARALLADPGKMAGAVEASQKAARASLSYEAIAARLTASPIFN